MAGALSRLAEIMREENAYLSTLVEQMLHTIVAWEEGEARISLYGFRSLHGALQRRLLREVIALVQGHESDIEFERIEAAMELAGRGRTGGVVEFPGGLRVERGYEELVISLKRGEAAAAPTSREWTLPIPGEVQLPEFGVVLYARELADVEISRDPAEAVLEAESLSTPLIVRTWREGDRFVPLGQTEATKLQDFFVNAKVPRGGAASDVARGIRRRDCMGGRTPD